MQTPKRFTGNENHSITVAEAVVFIRNFKKHYGAKSQPGCFLEKLAILETLNQPNAVGLRYYYGAAVCGETKLVLVGANGECNDLLESGIVKVSVAHPSFGKHGNYRDGATKHTISLKAASELTARYQENLQPNEIKGGFFGKNAVQMLLDHAPCVGVRFLFGAKNDGTRVIVAMCVDEYGRELFYGPVIEMTFLCPPICHDYVQTRNRISLLHAKNPIVSMRS